MAIMEEMKSFTPDVEVFSVDEAFLDITRCQHLGEPVEIARRIRETVYEISGGLPCSIGLSGDKTTAKFAAKLRKPNGFTVIPPWKAREALKNAPVRALCGIGPGIAQFLAERGIHTCGDMQKLPIGVLAKRFGNFGRRIWYMAQGQDPAGVEKNGLPPKSIGHGKVMPPDTQDRDTIRWYLRRMSEKVAERLRQHNFEAQHFFIGLLTREGWLASDRFKTGQPTRNGGEIMQLCESLLNNIWRRQGVFQCQITALDPRSHGSQFDMFAVDTTRVETLSRVMDEINWKYGALSLASAQLLERSTMPDVIAPAWKPHGHRQTIRL